MKLLLKLLHAADFDVEAAHLAAQFLDGQFHCLLHALAEHPGARGQGGYETDPDLVRGDGRRGHQRERGHKPNHFSFHTSVSPKSTFDRIPGGAYYGIPVTIETGKLNPGQLCAFVC